jgi:hypothetical protein
LLDSDGAYGQRWLRLRGDAMTTTFQKRQKEMKRMEKRKMKEEKRVQRKLDKTAEKESGVSTEEIMEPLTGPIPYDPEA